MTALPMASADTLRLGEFLPPVGAAAIYLLLYWRRARTLARERRQRPSGLQAASFTIAVLVVVAVQLPPLDTLADEVLVAHMVQHIVIGEIASLFIVFGLTGTMLGPLLRIRLTRPLRRLAHPLVALALWAVNLYVWHLPVLYQLAIRHDLVHALEHACLLWFGTLLWLGLLGPLPKPIWFASWKRLGYVFGVRFVGAILANILLWGQAVYYPVYRASDARHGLSPLSDENLAGGAMMVAQVLITTGLVAWLFVRFMREMEERQRLLDLAAEHGLALSEERAERAVLAGSTDRLRERLLEHGVDPARR